MRIFSGGERASLQNRKVAGRKCKAVLWQCISFFDMLYSYSTLSQGWSAVVLKPTAIRKHGILAVPPGMRPQGILENRRAGGAGSGNLPERTGLRFKIFHPGSENVGNEDISGGRINGIAGSKESEKGIYHTPWGQ